MVPPYGIITPYSVTPKSVVGTVVVVDGVVGAATVSVTPGEVKPLAVQVMLAVPAAAPVA